MKLHGIHGVRETVCANYLHYNVKKGWSMVAYMDMGRQSREVARPQFSNDTLVVLVGIPAVVGYL